MNENVRDGEDAGLFRTDATRVFVLKFAVPVLDALPKSASISSMPFIEQCACQDVGKEGAYNHSSQCMMNASDTPIEPK